MTRPFSISRILLIAAMLGLIGLAILAFRALKQDMEGYRATNQESIHWSAAQVEVELARFITAVTRYSSGDEATDHAEVAKRFDILWSRTGLFRTGSIGMRLRKYDESTGVIPILIAKLEQTEPDVMGLQRGDTATATELIEDYASLQRQLRRLTVNVLSQEQNRYAAIRSNIRASSRLTFVVWASALVLAVILVGVMLIETRRYERMLAEQARLADEAQAANRAKSRFLTMMSHELRTPMNGVLGMIALAKQSGLSENQLRLIAQAERSGQQMLGLLTDILEYADLDENGAQAARTTTATRQFAQEFGRALDDVASAAAALIRVNCTAETPAAVLVDATRVKTALNHFATFFVRTAGVRELDLNFAHDGDNLICEFDAIVPETTFRTEDLGAMLSADVDLGTEFSTDSIGPMIARAMIETIAGRMHLTWPEPGRARLYVSVPAPAARIVQNSVRVEARSDTTRLLLHALIDETDWRIWTPSDDAARVKVVLLEPPDEDEAAAVEQIRKQHPAAFVVSIGNPEKRARFDAVCALPLSADSLRSLLAPHVPAAGIA